MFQLLFKRFLPLLLIVAVQPAQAQFNNVAENNFTTKSNRENAPYSRFGIGEFRNGINPVMKGMGSISTAYSSPFSVNTDNPASYASILLTTYEGGLQGSRRTIRSGSDKVRAGMATINHLNMGVPVGKHAGLAFGFKPITHIYYRLHDSSNVPGYGDAVRTFAGDGSLNYAFIGAAGKYKGLSIGANFGYMFGTTLYSSLLQSNDAAQHVNDAFFAKAVKTGGIYWSTGAMYESKIKNGKWLRFGATFTLNQELDSKLDDLHISSNAGGSDTTFSKVGQKGKLTMPMMYGFGVQYSDSAKWTVGLDFKGANWSQYQSFARTDSVADLSYTMAVGGEFTPDPTSIRKYFSRVTYRLGFYYGQDYVYVRNTPINYYAVTFGAAIPFKKFSDRINTAFEIGRRGTETNGLFTESFFKCTVGISLNSQWFIKRQYD